MSGLLDGIHQDIQCLIVVLHARCEATLVTNVASVLSILLLDAPLQGMIDLGSDDHCLLEARSADGQYHELLAGQPVPGVAATVDDVEGGNGHHEGVRRLARQPCKVLVEGHLAGSSPSTAKGHGDRQDRVRAELGLAPAPLVLGSVQGLHHQLVYLCLLRHVHADELGPYDVVHVVDRLQDALPHEPALVPVPELESLVDPSARTAWHCGPEQGSLGAEVNLNGGVAT
mmetsp:Transcript_4741/g.15294  ORF Transcript_4741/g.15294 Transcript_4741/m.15294 type:complete len:229 (+) Transcript_4741:2101-2787(+)